MKVVILCGGRGMRLSEETESKPKPLVHVGDMPILWHIMSLYAHYGYKDFILALGYKGQMIKDYFLNFEETHNNFTINFGKGEKKVVYHEKNGIPDWNITFVNTGPHSNTGERIRKIEPYLGDDKEFFLTYGDGVSNIDIQKLYRHHKALGRACTLSGVQPLNPFGVIEPEGGLIRSFQEKPRTKRGFISGGFFVCDRNIFKSIPAGDQTTFEGDVLPKLAKSGELAVYEHHNFWYCVDTLKHLEDLNALYKRGERPWMVWEA